MLTPVKRRLREWREQGRHRLLTAVAFFIHLRLLDIRRLACYPYAARRIKQHAACTDIDALVDLVFAPLMSTIRPVQVRSEIVSFLNAINQHPPTNILEIGTGHGGMLFLFSKLAADNSLIVSIDLPGGKFGGGYRNYQTRLLKSFERPGGRIELLRCDSHDPKTLDRVRELFGDRKLDLLFIDGDHTYDGVRLDFEMYSPLVKSGGLIAFHDIAPHPANAAGEVHTFWAEIRQVHEVTELVESWQHGYGIGLIVKP